MSDPPQGPLGYIELPKDSGLNANLPMSRIPSRKYTPRKRDNPVGGGEQDTPQDPDSRGNAMDPAAPRPAPARMMFPTLDSAGDGFLLIPRPRNVAGHREISPRRNWRPNPEPTRAPTPEPIPEDISEFGHNKIKKLMWILIYFLIKPFALLIRYSIRLSVALLAALPILLVAFVVWAYEYGDPLNRLQKAMRELSKARNEARTSWALF